MTDVDYYGLVKAGLMAKLRTKTELFANAFQVTDKYSDITRGGDYFIVIKQGAAPRTKQTGKDAIFAWNFAADLYTRFVEQETAEALAESALSKLVLLLHPNSLIGVNSVKAVTLTWAQGFLLEPKNKNFIIKPLTITVEQLVRFNF